MSFTDNTGTGSIAQWQANYEVSPIALVGGIASNFPGGIYPIISLIQAQNFSGGPLQSSSQPTFSDFTAHFTPMPGATLIDNEYGEYPFANQQIAANAAILKPLRVSLMMIAPAPANGGYWQKTAAFTSLQSLLIQHTIQGGWYVVVTPSFTWDTMLLDSIIDVSANDTNQVQTRWQWNFHAPLLTQTQADNAQNTLVSKATQGLQTSGDPPRVTGLNNAVGATSSSVTPNLVPAARGLTSAASGIGAATQGVNSLTGN